MPAPDFPTRPTNRAPDPNGRDVPAPVTKGPDPAAPDMNEVVGRDDLLLVTFDTLRFDVAAELAASGRIPHLARHLPGGRWEERHAPGSFTYASHQAIFAGFLPTPAVPGPHPRLFAARFAGSETTAPGTYVFDAPDLVSGLAQAGYRTVCIGGVGFFNQRGPLGSVLPGMFQESHWEQEFSVASPTSFEAQVTRAEQVVGDLPEDRRLFLFVNVASLHQPNWFHLPGATRDAGDSRGGPGVRRPPHRAPLHRRTQPSALLCDRLLRPRHGLRGRRLHRAPHRSRGRLDRAIRPLLPGRRRMSRPVSRPLGTFPNHPRPYQSYVYA